MDDTKNRISRAKPGRLDLWIIALAAALFRGAHLFFWSKTPWFSLPSLDEIYHHIWAGQIADGNLLFPTAFFRAPFYAYFLGGVYAVFGTNPWAIRLIQSGIGVGGCVLVAILAGKIFDDRRIGFLAGLFMALSPMPALFESRLLLDWMLIPLSTLAMIFLVDSAENGKGRDFFLFGLFAGVFAITRPNILAVFPFLLLWAVSRWKKRWIRVAILAIVGIALPILPVFVHNIARGEPSLVATQGGLNLYLGNNPETDGITPVLPGHGGTWTVREAWKSAEFDTGEKMTSSDMSDFYLRKTLDFAKENLGQQIRLLGRKIAHLLSPVEHGNNGSPEFFKRYSPPLRSPFAWGLYVVLAAAGLPVVLRRRKAGVLLLWGVLYGATVVIFFVNARFRLPLLTAIVPMASAGVFGVYDSIAQRDFRGLGLSIGLGIIVVAAFAVGDNTRLSPRGEAESYFALGNLHLRAGRVEMADSAYAKALEISPAIDRASLNRGIVAFERGDYSRAKEFFAEEIAKGGEVSMANTNLGVIGRLEKDTADAINFGAVAVETDPINSQARINLAQSLVELGYADSALSVARRGLELDSLNLRLKLVAGTACLSIGRVDSAVVYFRGASSELEPSTIADYELSDVYSAEGAGASPDSVIRGYAFYNLGLAEAMRGDFSLALESFEKALHLIPNHADAWASYGGLLTQMNSDSEAEKALLRAIELGKGSPEIHYNLGLIYARGGNFPEAYARFSRSVETDSSFMPGREKIDILEKLAEDGKISLEIE